MTWALVSGASGGLGKAFAQRLAEDGNDLVLVARDESAMRQLAEELEGEHHRRVVVIPTDLSSQHEREQLLSELDHLQIAPEVLINNAGFGSLGDVVSLDADRLNDEIAVNCQAVVHLTRSLLPAMLDAHRGTVVNVASMAAFQPIPTMAIYAATKAFVLRFSQALWHELRGTGVSVLALCPGPTETPFFANAGNHNVLTRRRTPEQVVDSCFEALAAGRHTVADGRLNAVQAIAAKLAPIRLALPLAKLSVRPRD